MRTYSDTSPRSYVTDGQRRYSMYTSSPSGSEGATVPTSPPPWDGSAEGYGPVATDYGAYYKKVDAMGGCGCAQGCGGCGMGMGEGGLDFLNASDLGILAAVAGGVAGYFVLPKLNINKWVGVLVGALTANLGSSLIVK